MDSFSKTNLDSVTRNKLDQALKVDTAELRSLISLPIGTGGASFSKPVFDFSSGSISYNWSYRSKIDTPFNESGISQHMIVGNGQFVIAQTIPISVSYIERRSNSLYFKNFRDVRIEFNPVQFQRLQTEKLHKYLESQTNNIKNPLTKHSLDYSNKQLMKLEAWIKQKEVINKLLLSRTKMLESKGRDSMLNLKDSSLKQAEYFIRHYELVKDTYEKLKNFRDSLHKEFVVREQQVEAIRKYLFSKKKEGLRIDEVNQLLQRQGLDMGRLEKIYKLLGSIQTFSVGKVVPNHSELTMRNINLNGINFEYNRKYYFAISAGTIDFRARDFFINGEKRKPQFVYLVKAGKGPRMGTHVYLSWYKGKKQLLSSSRSVPIMDIYGISIESQWVLNKYLRVISEVAHSVSPNLLGGFTENKEGLDLRNKKSRAFSIKLSSYLPRMFSRIEAFYRYRGIDFQSFSSYYSNSASESWQIRGDQYLFKRSIKLDVAISKNNFENNYLPVRYNGSTTYKSASISFRKRKWPFISLGYMPSSQLSSFNGQIYENYYHNLTSTASHFYRIGKSLASSSLNYNRFYNDAADTGFLYYNSRNIYFNQIIQFARHTSLFNIIQSKSRNYNLITLEGGFSTKAWKKNIVSLGVKVNRLNHDPVKIGIYGNQQFIIPGVGVLQIWIEKAYLPEWKGGLVKNEFYTVGFTRTFK